jgi:quinol monooxygenase YgiN
VRLSALKIRKWVAIVTWGVALEASAQGTPPFVRWIDMQVEPGQLQAFHAAAARHVTAALRAEPGVLALHAAGDKNDPGRIRVLEVYADEAASRTHLQAPHFLEFREATDGMVTSRQVQDAVPIVLGAKPRLPAKALVRIAELEIDRARLEAYKAAVTEEIEASIRDEPGVLAIYSVALKDNPHHLRFFEIYADDEAYRKHIASPHFRKYVEVTQAMIGSRKLTEAQAVVLAAKPKAPTHYVCTSLVQAQGWYDFPRYLELMPVRHRRARSRAFIVEGLVPFGRT